MKKLADFRTKKQQNEKIVMLTAYDYPTAVFEDRAGVDILLIGDSVGRNLLGYESERDVTMADMLHHVKAVARGASQAYVMADMPFQAAETSDIALENARRFLDAGAHGVKMEGETNMVDQIAHVVAAGIDVCAHIGYTPQTVDRAAVQGKDFERAKALITVARQLQDAGAEMIVFELIPELLAKEITAVLDIPTIGIGAGRYCDGQVQVYCDILGLSGQVFRHAKAYDDLGTRYQEIFTQYVNEVKALKFPTKDNSAALSEEVAEQVRQWLDSF
ncbi:MAG: 3-methyl-2-oxobutanoate hydroxymethyltransferase [Thermodesulfobacteriota bacterium]|nr:3-methyl-2-oxobutanoate hydroxymethyltransferase [Thermodesulfobacteriota bacterium]